MSSVIQRSLSGGELDPVLWARSDVNKYMSGLRTLRNAIIRRNGGAQGRPGGTKIQASNGKARLIPFIYSQQTAYSVELSVGTGGSTFSSARFYLNGKSYLAQGATAYSSVTAYKLGDLVTSAGVTYYCTFGSFSSDPRLSGGTLSTFTNVAPPNSGHWSPLTGSIYEIPLPTGYSADLFNIRFDQTANDLTMTLNTTLRQVPQMVLRRWVDVNGFDVFGIFNSASQSYMTSSSPHNDQGDSNTIAIASAATVYAVAAISASSDTRAQFVFDDGTNASVKGTDITTTNSVPASGSPIQITWSAVPNAVNYNIYYMNKKTGVFGFLGATNLTTFQDNGITPDYTSPWIQSSNTMSNIFGGSPTNCPGACAYYQQRLFYGNSQLQPTGVYGSQTGLFDNFNVNVPSIATDSLFFKMAGQQDIIQHLVSLGTLLVFTYGTINSVPGDSSGAIAPSSCGPHRETIHGASSLRPLIVGEFVLYCQSQGSIIRDLGFNFQVDGYKGDDLTVFATHLFDNYTIVDWAYQQTPHSVIWAVRSDGTLLSCTYLREQQVLAWAHHDTLGAFESVCCVPEGNQVSVYAVVRRVINGSTVRFIERFYNQQFSPTLQLTAPFNDYRDFIGMDCATTFDGRNTSTDTMTVSGGTLWNETELLTLTLSANNFYTFVSADATNQNRIFIYDASGNLYRFKITVFSSATVVQGFVDRSLPVGMQGVGTSTWSHAIQRLTGLGYLEGQKISVWGDGCVVGSPNNAAYPVYTVSSGNVTLDKHYAVIQVGLPFITDIETLDIDTPAAMDNLGGRFKMVGEVTLYMVNSRSVFIGGANPDTDLTNLNKDPLYRLSEQKLRQNENYDNPMALETGKITQNIQGEWDSQGHVFIRNVDPTPILISAISPEGLYPMKVG